MTNIKNALQIETLVFGPIASSFQDQNVRTAIELEHAIELPEIASRRSGDEKSKIQIRPQGCIVSMEPFTHLTSAMDSDNWNHTDLSDFVFFTAGCYQEGDNLVIPTDAIPSAIDVSFLKDSRNPTIQALGNAFDLCLVATKMLRTSVLGLEPIRLLMNTLTIQFEEYSDKKVLIPLFARIFELCREYKEREKPLDLILCSESIRKEFADLMGSDWLKDATKVYGLALKIEECCRRVIPVGLLITIKTDYGLHIDPRNCKLYNSIHPLIGGERIIWEDSPLCSSEEDFMKLSMHRPSPSKESPEEIGGTDMAERSRSLTKKRHSTKKSLRKPTTSSSSAETLPISLEVQAQGPEMRMRSETGSTDRKSPLPGVASRTSSSSAETLPISLEAEERNSRTCAMTQIEIVNRKILNRMMYHDRVHDLATFFWTLRIRTHLYLP